MSVVSYYRDRGVVWVRVCGYGLWLADRRIVRPLFSERHGYERTLPLGRHWRIKVLRPKRRVR